ncbi:MAG: division/cell wall cluster transcriptional repressor MraZ [Rhodospirillales bacterium]|nr:division/cell wall cluster transcriptional repressor MraZ [Alphaproteobacteria bacterium]MCB1840813.1 division/cell wall cluster transcriptional repressor MraZ [Alphaproteobacteria bacterium]MCB9976401.1 division/cell wall cluster transcriptional repressor MraZ [Rhodospirillales bacterium]
MALFISTFTNKLDKKGRVSVPASFRSALGDRLHLGIVVFRAHNHPCLEGFEWDRMDEISARLEHFDLFSDEQDDLATSVFGESVHLHCDGEGRVMLPADLIEFCALDDYATFVGLGRKFQIWQPGLFEERKKAARAQVRERRLTIPSDKGDKA